MTKEEFEKSISEETVVIPLVRYEQLVNDSTILSIIKQMIEKDTCHYGLSEGTTKTIETILNIKRSNEE